MIGAEVQMQAGALQGILKVDETEGKVGHDGGLEGVAHADRQKQAEVHELCVLVLLRDPRLLKKRLQDTLLSKLSFLCSRSITVMIRLADPRHTEQHEDDESDSGRQGAHLERTGITAVIHLTIMLLVAWLQKSWASLMRMLILSSCTWAAEPPAVLTQAAGSLTWQRTHLHPSAAETFLRCRW